MPQIMRAVWVIAAVCGAIGNVAAAGRTPTEPKYEAAVEKKVMIPMPDGVRLAADIYLPALKGEPVDDEFPAITSLIVYGRGIHYYDALAKYMARRGYAFISVDIRGDGDSEGEFLPMGESIGRSGDLTDPGYDYYNTIEWIADQPWCNGKVGTTGLSYGSFNQWLMLPQRPPHLKAAFQWMGSGNVYKDAFWYGGTGPSYNTMVWSMQQSAEHLMRDGEREKALKYFRWLQDRPALVMARPYLTNEFVEPLIDTAPWMRDFITHTTFDEFWAARDIEDELDRIKTPCYVLEGWYDGHLRGNVAHFIELQEQKKHKLVVGPWMHGWEGLSRAGEMSFGLHAQLDVYEEHARWFDYWLKGKKNGVTDRPVEVFVMGDNEWKYPKRFPLSNTDYRKLYLHSDGDAHKEETDGTLDFTFLNLVGGSRPDRYKSDPDNPVPNNGGIGNVPDQGVQDQRKIIPRSDVLYYNSAQLEHDLEVIGPVRAVIHASSSARDTDWIVMLCDVHPDGYVQNLIEGELRASLRDGYGEHRSLEPDKVYPFEIDMLYTANTFKKGHRIGVIVRSSAAHRIAPNPQTGEDFINSGQAVIAENTIYHDWNHPSYILLPVIPDDDD